MRQGTATRIRWITGLALAGLAGCFGPGILDYSYPLAGGYMVTRASAHDIRVWAKTGPNTGTMIIPPKVVQVAWNDSFILAKQQHIDKVHDMPEPIPGHFSYWILDVKTPKLYGPLDNETFRMKRAAFGITERLELQDVQAFAR